MTAPTSDVLLHGAYRPTPSDAPTPPAPPAPPARRDGRAPWHPAARAGFRFAFAYLALYSVPLLLELVPVPRLQALYVDALWGPLVRWVGAHVLRLGAPVQRLPSGSGDTTFDWVYTLCLAAVAATVALAWSVADRRREYRALDGRLRVLVRYSLGVVMFGYGAFKIVKAQFPDPGLDRLLEPYGSFSPMGLAWSFMGHSYAYNLYAGLGEAVGAFLLFFRRTTLLGALVTAAVLTNVMMVNYAFDVPVKLLSTHLFLMALYLALPGLRRVVDAVLGRAVSAAPEPAPALAPRARIARAVAKTLVVGAAVALPLAQARSTDRMYADFRTAPLYGIYDVTAFERGGRPVPPLFTDGTRWRRVVVGGPRHVSVYAATDSVTRYAARVDTVAHRVTLAGTTDSAVVATLAYAPAAGGLELRGTFAGDSVRATLRRVDHTKFRLVSRGFHWVNEQPFNR